MGFMNFDVERWSVIIGGLAAAIALWQFVVANATRKEDLRWRQAERADDMLNLILANPKVINAFHLLDWNGGKRFTYTNGDHTSSIMATWSEQDDDLGGTSDSMREMFVRESFDALYEAFERLDHAVEIKVVAFKDIAQPFRYYVEKIRQRTPAFLVFEKNQGYDTARHFLTYYNTPSAHS